MSITEEKKMLTLSGRGVTLGGEYAEHLIDELSKRGVSAQIADYDGEYTVIGNTECASDAVAAARAELDYHMAVCDQLTEIRWSSNLEKIDPWVFSESNLTSVTVPGTVKTVAGMVFANNAALEEITFEEGVTSISSEVLYGSNHVKTINLPASLEVLGQFNTFMLRGDCASEFPTINYAGTMAQWADLFRGWADDPDVVDYGTYVYFDIHCSDGVLKATKTLN